MSVDIDELAKRLETQVLEDAKEAFSETVIEYAYNPRNMGEISDADGVGKITGTCGDTVQIQIRVENGRISESGFITDGCGTSIACGSMLTEMITDKTIEEALMITSDDLLRSLGGLPDEYVHCSVLAVNVLREAIADYRELRSNKQT
ncbi:MAG: iron-sulfur cluster assembly scaffold protein [Candidatus Methanogaster sp.]|uniref:Iron-sulfur cluster assembly scaffold protein n=1 Tax=Candidatus Methanogaster sp. TaxID=3386292 RepID=A0AC61L2Y5_9EURY|nr:MAG: iron-sulfur cluster assembly scaffold protein [ANME-2 cluster archaeon]